MLAVVGSLSIDRIGGGPPRVGGGPFHCGRGLRAFGRRAMLVARCAEADRGLLLPPLVRLGLPVAWRPAASTPAFSMEYDGDERRMVVEALGDSWAPGDAADALAGVEWVHVAPLARSDFPPETLAALARGRRLSLDGQGLVRPARTGPLEPDGDYDPEVLRHVSILKLADHEAQVLVEGLDERSLRRLGVPEVVVTLGSRGCVVFADGIAEHVPARAAAGASDPTGAGDAFAAVYLAARSTGAAAPAAARLASTLVTELLDGRVG